MKRRNTTRFRFRLRLSFFTFALTLLFSSAFSQTDIYDAGTLRSRINTDITANGSKAITGNILNKILNGGLNILPTYTNGLTQSGSYPFTVKLGGTLGMHTIINGLSAYDFSFNNIRNFQISAANLYLPGVPAGTAGTLRMLALDPVTYKVYHLPLNVSTDSTGSTTVTTNTLWGQIQGSIANQPDLLDSLRARQYKLPAGTVNQYIRGDATLGNFATDVKTVGDSYYITRADTNTSIQGKLIFSNGLIQNGNLVNVLVDNALFNAKKLQGYLINPVQPQDQMTLVFNASKQMWEPAFSSGTGSGTADGNNYPNALSLSPTGDLTLGVTGLPDLSANLDGRYITHTDLNNYYDSTSYWFDSTYFSGTGALSNPITLKASNAYATQVGLNDTATALRLAMQAGGANIYNSDGTLAGDRTVIIGNHLLEFQDSPDENTYLSVAHNATIGGTIASYTLGADGAQSYIMHYANGNINRYAGSYHDTAQITEEMHPQRYHLFADSYNEGTGQNASGSSITMESRFVYLGQRDGNYQIDSLADAPAPSGGAYKALVYEQVPGNETQLRLYSKDLSTFSDGNNYVSGGNLTGSTLTLNRSGMADLAITGFNTATGAPEDIEFTAGATGKPAAGASTITFTGSTGYEVRVIRGTVPQSTINKGDGFYYTKASSSETLTLGQPLVSGEYVRIQFYKPSGTITY